MKQKTIGEILAEERTRHRISKAQLSRKTRIREAYLDALEENRFEELPPAAFVKGYIKTYAKMFGFDHAPVLALLRRDYKESATGTLIPRDFIAPVIVSARPMRTVTVVVVLLFAGLLSVFGYIGFQWYQLQKPPQLVIEEPVLRQEVGPNVTVRGFTDPEAVVAVNTQPVALRPDGTFETQVTFVSEGIATLVIESTDRRGKTAQEVRQIYVRF